MICVKKRREPSRASTSTRTLLPVVRTLVRSPGDQSPPATLAARTVLSRFRTSAPQPGRGVGTSNRVARAVLEARPEPWPNPAIPWLRSACVIVGGPSVVPKRSVRDFLPRPHQYRRDGLHPRVLARQAMVDRRAAHRIHQNPADLGAGHPCPWRNASSTRGCPCSRSPRLEADGLRRLEGRHLARRGSPPPVWTMARLSTATLGASASLSSFALPRPRSIRRPRMVMPWIHRRAPLARRLGDRYGYIAQKATVVCAAQTPTALSITEDAPRAGRRLRPLTIARA